MFTRMSFVTSSSVVLLMSGIVGAQLDDVSAKGSASKGGKTCSGDMTFDSGADETLIGRDWAKALGLLDNTGAPVGNNGAKKFNDGEIDTWCFDDVEIEATDSDGRKCKSKQTVYVSKKEDSWASSHLLGVPWQTAVDACYRAKGKKLLWPWEAPKPVDPKKETTPKPDSKSGAVKRVMEVTVQNGPLPPIIVELVPHVGFGFSIIPQLVALELNAVPVGMIDLSVVDPVGWSVLGVSSQNISQQTMFQVVEVSMVDLGIGPPVLGPVQFLVANDANSDFGVLGDNLLLGSIGCDEFVWSSAESALYFYNPESAYSTGFESDQFAADPLGIPFNGVPAPTPGAQGWYQPIISTATNVSDDYLAFEYAGNTLGIPPNPAGGTQFVAGRNVGNIGTEAHNVRTQRSQCFVSSETYCVQWDICFNFGGTVPAVDNVGSFSLQPSATSRFWQTLYRWVTPASADFVKAEVNCFNAAGLATNNLIAGPEWSMLQLNHWYRQRFEFDFATNQIIEVAITDITGGGAEVVINPVDWFLAGGATPTQPMPTDYRFFTGGTVAGNTIAWDNFSISLGQCETLCYADCDGSGNLDFFDFLCFQNAFNAGLAYADCDGSGSLDFFDFLCFQNSFNAGCP